LINQWLGIICGVAIFLICILANNKVKKKIKNMAS
jgi:tetrahydromethanopterin S-methyltransferase subunit E